VAKFWRGHKHELKPLSEAEAYARCHGSRGEEVRIVKVEPRRPHYDIDPSGERLREAFEKRLEKRDPDDDAELPPLEN
jgi:hypothetical protein